MPDELELENAAKAARDRLSHVETRGQELADAIQSWMKSDPFGAVYTIADDRMSWELRWRFNTPVPPAWGLILADAAVNLHSALDNLLHYIAEHEKATEKELGRVQFPVVTDADKWKDSTRRISMLPPRVREAIEALQPSNRPEGERPSDGLAILTSLSNKNKHRIALASTIRPQEMGHSFAVSFEGGGVTADGPPRTTFHSGYIEDGALILEHDTAPDRIEGVEGKGKYKAQVVVIDQWGNTHGVTAVLAALLTYVTTVLEVVLEAWQQSEPTD